MKSTLGMPRSGGHISGHDKPWLRVKRAALLHLDGFLTRVNVRYKFESKIISTNK